MIKYVWLIPYSVSYAFYLLYLIHMFQLNTYKRNEQLIWMRRNFLKILSKEIIPVITFVLGFITENKNWILITMLWVISIFLLYKKTSSKKPLVYTGRVIRMLITHGIIVLVVFFVVIIVNASVIICVFSVLYAVLPLMIIVVNNLNIPIQTAINCKYVNEARKKIADMNDLIVIGITGSYGKTSVKFFLTDLLSVKFNVLCTPLNYNTDLGVTKTIRESLNATHQVFVCEMGARYENDIQAICDIVYPKYGIITSIGPQHLETFGTIQNIIKTKFELYNSIPQDGTIFLNYDNEYIKSYNGNVHQVGFGKDPDSKFRLIDLKMSAKGSAFTVALQEKEIVEFTTGLIGEYNILDIVAAISVAYSMGVPVKDLVRRVKKLKPVNHRLQLLPKQGKISIIDDAYNSNPSGFRGAIDTLAFFEETKILVTPGMIELGEKEYELNYEAGKYASEKCDYIILVGEKQTKPLYEGISSNSEFDIERLYVVERLEQMWDIIGRLPDTEKIILLENDLPDNY